MAAWLGVAVLIAAGCGDEADPAGAAESQPEAEAAAPEEESTPEEFDGDRLCELLEVAEIEAEFGEHGAVEEGFLDFRHCLWFVGPQVVQVSYDPPVVSSVEEHYASVRGFAADVSTITDVDGVGDGAFVEVFDYPASDQVSLTFWSRGVPAVLSILFDGIPDGTDAAAVDETTDSLVALAERVLERL